MVKGTDQIVYEPSASDLRRKSVRQKSSAPCRFSAAIVSARQDQADQGLLVERIKGLTIHPILESALAALSKPHLDPPRTINPEIGLSNYIAFTK
jgi:hypothetical protein